MEEQHFDAANIQDKQRNINDRYTRFGRVNERCVMGHMIYVASLLCRLKKLAARRLSQLNDSQMVQQFYRDVDEEEAWIK